MTAPSAIALLAEVRRAGGVLTPNPDGSLGVDLPAPEMHRLVPLLRQRKPDLLVLLRPLVLPCIGCGGMYRWQGGAGLWHCGRCEPDPSAHRLRGVTLETLGNQPITLQPPTGDLGAPGCWARTAAGDVVELVLYEASGVEVLTRLLKGAHLAWHRPELLHWEWDWEARA